MRNPLAYPAEFPLHLQPPPTLVLPHAMFSTQLSLFLGVVAWLLGEAKRKFSFNRDDDPSTSISKMLAELRALGAGAEILDASPLKLRAAWGETACRILLFCADAALSAKGFKWSRPSYPVEP